MNCKPGDMAIVVSSRMGNEGKVVTCLKLRPYSNLLLGPVWETDNHSILSWTLSGGYEKLNTIPDCLIRPLRDSDGTDETLSWIDVPSEVTA